ncbi:molecular chaperone [Entomohabitans teleogrylli]|uniref:fimbrial biogenesis chaperone n=1 Tax=Entomohabitans teleogrylli TaxID=1384589 RepID=UPI00073D6C55|nr:fimbria/pilus periplasmic chaperone [Entomohabitans teleogrylli]
MSNRYITTSFGFFAFIITVLISFPSLASVVINGTRVVYSSDASEVTVQVTNNGKRAVLLQSWLDTGDEKATPDKIVVPFVLIPPVNRVDAGKTQTLRISAKSTSGLRQDRESLFWLNVLEIPGRPDKAAMPDNYLQLAIRSRIKFFYRPIILKGAASQAPEQAVWSDSGSGLKVVNSTPYYLSLTTVTFNGKTMDIDMVPPEDSRTFNHIKVTRGKNIKVAWIDDYGAIRTQDFTVK